MNMKVYTRTGDLGTTSLFSGGRVGKDDIRLEAYGCLDELSAILGLLGTEPLPDGVGERLHDIQDVLLEMGGTLADAEGRLPRPVERWASTPLEAWIDDMDAELEPLRSFIHPGGTRAAAVAHVARTVCRRAERRVQALSATDPESVAEGVIAYLNRLSDLLFVLARWLNARSGVADVLWRRPSA